MSTNSKDLYEFLFDHGYSDKSTIEPTKILSKIPEHLKPYFWRGYFDGDGSLCFSKLNRSKSLQFSAVFEYKWGEVKSWLQSIGIEKTSAINSITKKEHKYSKFYIFKTDDIHKVINYFNKSKIGLERKTKKIIEFINEYPLTTSNI